jgi:signal transduction histidine kinase/HPt (histidine-containing phosphotransfer) domain-containing protein
MQPNALKAIIKSVYPLLAIQLALSFATLIAIFFASDSLLFTNAAAVAVVTGCVLSVLLLFAWRYAYAALREEQRNFMRLEMRTEALRRDFSDMLEEAKEKNKAIALLRNVAVAASAARTAKDAVQSCIEEICDYTGWPVGHAYFYDETDGKLRSLGTWRLSDSGRYGTFRAASEQAVYAPGSGLAGRVYQAGASKWASEIPYDESFARKEAAQSAGLSAAFAFPVCIGGEALVVLEFFTDGQKKPTRDALQMAERVGGHVAVALERERNEERLIRQRDQAEALSRAKNDVLSGVGTALYAQVRQAVAAVRPDAEEARQAGRSALCVLEDIRLLSSSEPDSAPRACVPFDVRSLTESAARAFEAALRQKGLPPVKTEIADDVPAVLLGDMGAVRYALRRLLGHAVSGVRKGEVSLRVTADAIGAIRFCVRDPGAPAPQEGAEGMFEPFAWGTLGLAACRALCRRLGGSVVAECKEGEGIAFRMALPLKRAEAGVTPVPPDAVPDEEEPTAEGPSPAQPPIDMTRLRSVTDGDAEREEELVRLFFAHAYQALDALRQDADGRGDGEGWRRAAHSLKGASANLGARPLFRVCNEAESLPAPSHAEKAEMLKAIAARVEELKAFLAGR